MGDDSRRIPIQRNRSLTLTSTIMETTTPIDPKWQWHYEAYRKYQKPADSVADFLERYYKRDRYHGRGEAYAAVLLASYESEAAEKGCCWISYHDSVTGECVSYYPNTVTV